MIDQTIADLVQYALEHGLIAEDDRVYSVNALLERHRADGESMPYVYAAALLFYHHENPYKQIPKALKYGGDLRSGRFFAARLGRWMAGAAHWADVDLVVPVPLHWYRKWRRGYNQAEVLAAELAREGK